MGVRGFYKHESPLLKVTGFLLHFFGLAVFEPTSYARFKKNDGSNIITNRKCKLYYGIIEMNIIFADRKLEKYAYDYKLAQRKLGNKQAELFHKRLNDLYDADSFEVLLHLPGNHHALSENRSGEWACSLEQPTRLVYAPILEGVNNGSIKLKELKDLRILEITNYHEKKNNR